MEKENKTADSLRGIFSTEDLEKEIEELKKKLINKSILRRPYKNQKRKDMDLANAYQKGLMDGRKEQKENEINTLLKSGKIDGLDRFIEWRQDDVKRVLEKERQRLGAIVKEKYIEKEEVAKAIDELRMSNSTRLMHNLDGEEVDFLISSKETKQKLGLK